MKSQKTRRGFLNYFEKANHTQVPSSPVVPADDPTLLFTNAGMNQFKDVFLGQSHRDYTKATTSQKCVRVGGKHNDLENVGHTSRHLTFFEMLGNFSFGDYFKKEAIASAWEVTTNIFKFDPKDLWITVFHEDDESFELWQKFVKPERIIRKGEKDNFWSMGDVGPCGPCSELFFDRGAKYGPARSPAEDVTEERYIEFWNLVFMQFNRDHTGAMHALPKTGVDTGAGLERIVSLQMGVDSLFETDILRGLISEVEKLCGKKYHSQAPFKVIADHMRTLSFAIADGVQPSNVDRGYVLRKVLRRAVRYGRQIGLDKPFMGQLLSPLISMMGEDYPELSLNKSRIEEILTLEEENFLKTLKRGGNILSQVIAKSEKEKTISGDDAFKLKDTYGLPLDEIMLLAKDDGLTVDIERFEDLEKEAKERSKKSHKKTEQLAEESSFEHFAATDFVGYEATTAEGCIVGIVRDGKAVDSLNEGEEGTIVLDKTPFYAEKGGQVADQGVLENKNAQFRVIDCQTPFADVIAHTGVMKEGSFKVGDTLSAVVNKKRRLAIMSNHTATHLLHWALQEVLGEHVRQAGSVVDQERLRFDFSHHKGVSAEELKLIEHLVNEKIRENRRLENYELAFSEVQKRGEIKQFFGEKYGQRVRVVDIHYSKELCGGTHVKATGDIGYFRITKESSVASGVRRIEAVTGFEAEKFAEKSDELIEMLCEKLKTRPHQLLDRVDKIEIELDQLKGELKQFKTAMMSGQIDALLGEVKGETVPYLIRSVDLGPKELKDLADQLMERGSSLALLLIGHEKDKCMLLARVSPDLIGRKIHANDLIREVAPIVEGKGGGKADAAQGGGTAVDKIPDAIKEAEKWILSKGK